MYSYNDAVFLHHQRGRGLSALWQMKKGSLPYCCFHHGFLQCRQWNIIKKITVVVRCDALFNGIWNMGRYSHLYSEVCCILRNVKCICFSTNKMEGCTGRGRLLSIKRIIVLLYMYIIYQIIRQHPSKRSKLKASENIVLPVLCLVTLISLHPLPHHLRP